jgi:hypothetical protein
VTAARVVERPPGPLRRWDEYLLLRERVIKHLGHLPEPALGPGGQVLPAVVSVRNYSSPSP